MDNSNKKTAIRIALVTLLLVMVTSPLGWYIAREKAEQSAVSLAMEESRRLIEHAHALHSGSNVHAPALAQHAADAVVGGLFDIAEIYSASGTKLAESLTPEGAAIEKELPSHRRPGYTEPSYESLTLPDGRWALRIFVPLYPSAPSAKPVLTGYFEGVRVIPAWQHDEILSNAFSMASLVGLAALLCGAVIYPVVVHLSADNRRKAQEVLQSNVSMMEALGRAIARRDSDTGAHNYRVAWIAARIGEAMGLNSRDMQALIAGSFLHDIGKIGIPDAILLKPGKLDDEELATMRTHVTHGEQILLNIGWLDMANQVVAGHHEKWNGQGYPRQLQGESIPLPARIFAVADVFDALCSKRPYKAPMPFAEAMAILARDRGQHFDPTVLDAFQSIAQDVHAHLNGCTEDECRLLLEDRVRLYFGLD